MGMFVNEILALLNGVFALLNGLLGNWANLAAPAPELTAAGVTLTSGLGDIVSYVMKILGDLLQAISMA